MNYRKSVRLFRSTWAIPALVALSSAAGLVIALAADGWYDAFSAVLLSIPVWLIGLSWKTAVIQKRRLENAALVHSNASSLP